jgi:hypothetical protein
VRGKTSTKLPTMPLISNVPVHLFPPVARRIAPCSPAKRRRPSLSPSLLGFRRRRRPLPAAALAGGAPRFGRSSSALLLPTSCACFFPVPHLTAPLSRPKRPCPGPAAAPLSGGAPHRRRPLPAVPLDVGVRLPLDLPRPSSSLEICK